MITSQVEYLTPNDCGELLRKNSHNRDISKSRVRTYAKEMSDNRWNLNGEAIIIADNGDVMNGQHRMLACIESGKRLSTMVTRGVARDTFGTIDSGKNRSGADVFSIATGIKGEVAKASISAATYIILFEESKNGAIANGGNTQHLTRPAALSMFLEENIRIINIYNEVKKVCGRNNSGVSLGEIIFLWYEMEKIDKERTQSFFSGFLTGAGLGVNDPRLVLRNKLLAQITSHTKLTKPARLGSVINAWKWHIKSFESKYHSNLFSNIDTSLQSLKEMIGNK